MRVAVLLAVLLVANPAPAAVLTWPGPAPCDASLGNCISNANPSDIIRIANLDSADIPVGADFNLYIQDPSQNAFEHIARGANITDNWTRLRHPLLDGNPCARMQVTQSGDQGVFNAHPVGVWYTGTHWAIVNQDLANMPENAAFHVMVDGDSLGCDLFSDRFAVGGF